MNVDSLPATAESCEGDERRITLRRLEEEKGESLRKLDLKSEALMAKPKGSGGKDKSVTTPRKFELSRKLEIPSLVDQLQPAGSSVVPRGAKAPTRTISLDDANEPVNFDLRHLVNKKKNHRQKRHSDPAAGHAKRSSLKKTSSYGMTEEIVEHIPISISTKKNSWNHLPKLAAKSKSNEPKKALMRGSGSSPSLSTITAVSSTATTTTATSTNESAQSTMKRNVSFSKIIIRDYDVTVGDGACMGPPVALDWNYQEHAPMDVLDYETARLSRPRSQAEMRMTPGQRVQRLKDGAGLSQSEILAATKEALKTHHQRTKTVKLLPLMKLEQAVESVTRKAKRLAKKTISRSLSSGHLARSNGDTLMADTSRHSCPGSFQDELALSKDFACLEERTRQNQELLDECVHYPKGKSTRKPRHSCPATFEDFACLEERTRQNQELLDECVHYPRGKSTRKPRHSCPTTFEDFACLEERTSQNSEC